ncbi:MAG: hypothetical protein WEG36_01070 [Gemmatimonadota bacterium]
MRPSTFAWTLAILLLAGCEQPPGAEILETFEPGAPKAEVLARIPHGGVVASDPMEAPLILQGYWFEQYFVDGGIVEVMWLHDVERGYPEEEFRRNLNPVIFRDEVLDGWGWSHFDRRQADWRIIERQPGMVGRYPEPGEDFIRERAPDRPGAPEAIPADTAPTGPRGDGSGSGTTA